MALGAMENPWTHVIAPELCFFFLDMKVIVKSQITTVILDEGQFEVSNTLI